MVRKRWKVWKEENNKDEREVEETILRELKEEKEQRVWYKKWDGSQKTEEKINFHDIMKKLHCLLMEEEGNNFSKMFVQQMNEDESCL